MYNIMGSITSSTHDDYLKGPVSRWVDEITRLAEEDRMDTFIFAPEDATEDQLRMFSEEVVPQVRANLGI